MGQTHTVASRETNSLATGIPPAIPVVQTPRSRNKTTLFVPLHLTIDSESTGVNALCMTVLTDSNDDMLKPLMERSGTPDGCMVLERMSLVGALNPLPVDLEFQLKGFPNTHEYHDDIGDSDDISDGDDIVLCVPKFAQGGFAESELYRHPCSTDTLHGFGNIRMASDSQPYTSLQRYDPAPVADIPSLTPTSTAQDRTAASLAAMSVVQTNSFLYNLLTTRKTDIETRFPDSSIVPVSSTAVIISPDIIGAVRESIKTSVVDKIKFMQDTPLSLSWTITSDTVASVGDALRARDSTVPCIVVLLFDIRYIQFHNILYV